MSTRVILSLLKMSVSLHIALAAETHLAEGLTLKLWLTTKVEKSLILLESTRKLTECVSVYTLWMCVTFILTLL
jgi:hypothetical protein